MRSQRRYPGALHEHAWPNTIRPCIPPCDVAEADAVERYIKDAAEALGGIDILVNNASGFGAGDSEQGSAAAIDVDLMGTVRATRAAKAWPVASDPASVVHIASIAGQAASALTAPTAQSRRP